MTDLLDDHDVLLADLDGTLYRGPEAVPGAVEAVASAAKRGVRTVYVTNNASRRPSEVSEHLRELGFAATDDDVATSSQAAAAMLAEQLPAGAAVLVVGTSALAEEITAVGLSISTTAAGAAAVVQGHSPDTGWRQLAEACVAVRAGALWVACNLDPTLPTERGPLPGNGSMVSVLRVATGREPQVAGKPAPSLVRTAARRTGAQRPLMIGDRLDTDIEGGRAAGMPSLLVMTGSTDATDLLGAPMRMRPDYIGADMSALERSAAELAPGPKLGWTVRGGDPLVLDGAGDPLDALRALCAAQWAAGGGPVGVSAAGGPAADALRALGLDGVTSATVAGVITPPGAQQP